MEPTPATCERDTLIETHLKLVPPIARRVKKKLPPSFELDDLIGEGYIGLMRAAERYDPTNHGGTPFSAFARPRIRGAMVDSVRRKAYQENTRNPLEDAPEPITTPKLPYLIKYGKAIPRPARGFEAKLLPEPIAAALRRLTVRQRAILVACYADAGGLNAVASTLHLDLAEVTAAHDAALEILRSAASRNLSRMRSTQIYFDVTDRAA